MKQIMRLSILLILMACVALVGCGEVKNLDLESRLGKGALGQAFKVIVLIGERDMSALADMVHPTKGLLFSPYGYIEEKSLVFPADQLPKLLQSSETYEWGIYDGIGEPIRMTFEQYFDRFVYDEDFRNPQIIGNNILVGQGNSLNNMDQVFPGNEFVEFHFVGMDPQYGGTDWRSLRLIFEQVDGTWYLSAIVHDEWTI